MGRPFKWIREVQLAQNAAAFRCRQQLAETKGVGVPGFKKQRLNCVIQKVPGSNLSSARHSPGGLRHAIVSQISDL